MHASLLSLFADGADQAQRKLKTFPELIGLEKQRSQDTAQLTVRLKMSYSYLVVLMQEGKDLGADPAQPPEAIVWR